MIPPKRSWTQSAYSATKALKDYCGKFFDFTEDDNNDKKFGDEKKSSKKKKRKNRKKTK